MRSMAIAVLAFVGILPALVMPVPQTGNLGNVIDQSAMATAEAVTQPNFVVIVTDDQKWDSIGRCLPNFDPYDLDAGDGACMPHLQDDVMDAGTTFYKGEVTQSLCCPSRASILTGQYSTNHGVTVNDVNLFDDSSNLATWLDAAGYRTALIGKYLNGYGERDTEAYIPPGWDTWESYHAYRISNGDNPYTDYPWISWSEGDTEPVVTRFNNVDSTSGAACAEGNLYSTDLICRRSLDFLEADQTDPFFLFLTPSSPHSPYTIADRHLDVFADVEIPSYPDTNLVPSPNPPAYLPVDPLTDTILGHADEKQRQILELTLTVDDMIGALHDQLVADGRLDETVWVFISDNGMASGEHRWRDKKCEYYACHRVPFIVACPPGVCPEAGAGVADPDNYALNIDIAPTIAELAGVTPTLAIDGRSLVPILNDPSAPWRDEYFIYGDRPNYNGIVATSIDGHIYKYVELPQRDDVEMFDLDEDPWELINLAGDPAHVAVQADLDSRLEAHVTGGPPANQSPTAAFNASCPDLTCDFIDASTDSDGTVTSWAWDFDDGSTSTLQNPSHSYAAAGTYTVALTVTDEDGASGSTSEVVTIADPGGPPVAAFMTACVGFACDFTDMSAGAVVAWDWDFGDGATSTEQHPSHTYSGVGTYSVTLTVTDDVGDSDTLMSDLEINEPSSTMHIGDLDGSGVRQAGSWVATVDVFVADEFDAGVSGAEVTLSRRGGAIVTCTTDAFGSCQIQLAVTAAREMVTVDDVVHPTLTYSSVDNTDPDGDSDGTSITVNRP